MQVNDIVELKIKSLGTNGEGVSQTEDATIFVPFCLPGEIVTAKITKQKKNIAEGRVVKILKKSQERVVPPCPYYGVCGGCDLQHVKYERQLEFKQNLVKNNLHKIAKINADVCECVASDNEYCYRNKISLPISVNGAGMFEQNSNKIVEINKCLLSEEWTTKLITAFNNWFKNNKIESYNRQNRNGTLRHLVARYENNSLLVCLVATQNVQKIQEFAQLLKKNFASFGLFININSQKTAKIFGTKFIHIAGIKNIQLNNFGLSYPVSIGSFEQVNPQIAQKIYQKVASEVACERIVNAYSGAGLLSAIIAKKAKHVFAIEIDKNAHANAEELKQSNNITNLTNICGDCATEVQKVGEFDSIVFDPPRSGCDKKVLETINKVSPQKIVYISCNSATLARDVSQLKNYKITFIQPYDMFPQTKHVETLCVLCRIA